MIVPDTTCTHHDDLQTDTSNSTGVDFFKKHLRLTCKLLAIMQQSPVERVNSEKYSRFPLCAHGSIKYLPKNI